MPLPRSPVAGRTRNKASEKQGESSTTETPTNTWSSGTPTSIEASTVTITEQTAGRHTPAPPPPRDGADDVTAGSTGATKRTEPTQAATVQALNETAQPGCSKPPAQKKAKSVASSTSSTRRRDLLARKKLEELRLEEIQARAALMRTTIELESIASETEADDIEEDAVSDHVQQWLEESQHEAPRVEKAAPVQVAAATNTGEQQAAGGSGGSDIASLAQAITEALQSQKPAAPAPPRFLQELPTFEGDTNDWLAFKAVYEDSSENFSGIQNVARLRRALKGRALEDVRSLLYASREPAEIMAALERRFGRPDVLVLAELEKLKKTRPLSDCTRDICGLASRINNCVATVRSLNRAAYLHSPELVRQTLEKMTPALRYRWCDYRAQHTGEEPELVKIAAFLSAEADRCNAFSIPEVEERAARRQVAHATEEAGPSDETTLATVANKGDKTSERNRGCLLCKREHPLVKCSEFAKQEVNRRWDIATKARACYRCLNTGHSWRTCRAKPCQAEGCRRRHHTLLHKEMKTQDGADAVAASSNTDSVNTLMESRAYLKIVPVELTGPTGRKAKVHALLDEGSTITLMDAEVAESIGARGRAEPLTIEAVGGNKICQENSIALQAVRIKGAHYSKRLKLTGARTISGLNLTPQAVTKQTVDKCPHLRAVANRLVYEKVRPALLIGQDNWALITSRQLLAGKPHLPVASRTQLGWVLHGVNSSATRPINSVHHLSQWNIKIEKMIKDNFALEALGVEPRRPTTDMESRAVAVLDATTRRLEDGRFETGLIWKDNSEVLPESRALAMSRLVSTEKKLGRNPTLREEYARQIHDLIAKGYAEPAPSGTPERVWYLPHFEVQHPQKRKMRLVFDAAAKTGGRCLNDALLAGPDLLQPLFGVLLRFRQGPVAVAADIKEMFLQVRIRPEDRDCLRFLWRDSPEEPPKTFRMTSLIFGASSSPCTAIYIKDRNAAEHAQQHPEAARAIVHNHYMDDYLQSFWGEEEARDTATRVAEVHSKAHFRLCGFASNRPAAIRGLRNEEEPGREVVDVAQDTEKTLGLRWHLKTDHLSFVVHARNTPTEAMEGLRRPTKREVTSAVMSVFDPLGLAAPVLLQGKKLIQETWRQGTGWDDPISPELQPSWLSYTTSLEQLRDLRVQRHIARSRQGGDLHVFTDASEEAYAAAAYWRSADENGQIHVALIAGKARVTPLKPTSIPRLELQAALLGARLGASVREQLGLETNSTTYWTDSTTVLSWIQAGPRTFKTYVAHRLAEIEDTTKPHEWRWVPTAQNVADDATRNLPSNFGSNHRWFHGPDFLRLPAHQFPEKKVVSRAVGGEEELRGTVATVTCATAPPIPDVERFSTWNRLLRATARVLQFVELLRRPRATNAARQVDNDPTWRKTAPTRRRVASQRQRTQTEGPHDRFIALDPSLLRRAESLLIRGSQEKDFAEDLRRAKQSLPPKKGSRLRRLDVAISNDGVLRLRGRVGAAKGVEEETKSPAVLDGKAHLAELIVKHYHALLQHCHHSAVINEVRQRYWILGLRGVTKKIVKNCAWCRLRRTQPTTQPFGDLPAERLRHGAPPFTCTAVDFFGPMYVTVGRRVEKRWGVLFTCLTTRAVHLELSASLSTTSMVLALRRMAARRGTPKTLYSDNGTNFVSANKELKRDLRGLQEEAGNAGIKWKFIPPGAPSMGGAWERLVRSVKVALAATLNERTPREETLHTLLTEAEHTINSRPLTEVSTDPEDPENLTPNHFLIGRSCGAWRTGNYEDMDPSRPSWRAAQRLADLFWARWLKEYLPTLVARAPGGQTRKITVGDIVLIADGTLPRNLWPRGEVVRAHPGPDGRVRVAEVRTTGGIMRRPTTRMVVLVEAKAAATISPAPDEVVEQRGEAVASEISRPTQQRTAIDTRLPRQPKERARWRGCGRRGTRHQ